MTGYSGPASLGVALQAHCSQPPDAIATWNIGVGSDPSEQTVASCFQGSFNPGGIPTTLSVVGCGSHILTVTPEGLGTSIGDTTEHALAAPLHFSIKLC